jgi:hypothetical protein
MTTPTAPLSSPPLNSEPEIPVSAPSRPFVVSMRPVRP